MPPYTHTFSLGWELSWSGYYSGSPASPHWCESGSHCVCFECMFQFIFTWIFVFSKHSLEKVIVGWIPCLDERFRFSISLCEHIDWPSERAYSCNMYIVEWGSSIRAQFTLVQSLVRIWRCRNWTCILVFGTPYHKCLLILAYWAHQPIWWSQRGASLGSIGWYYSLHAYVVYTCYHGIMSNPLCISALIFILCSDSIIRFLSNNNYKLRSGLLKHFSFMTSFYLRNFFLTPGI